MKRFILIFLSVLLVLCTLFVLGCDESGNSKKPINNSTIGNSTGSKTEQSTDNSTQSCSHSFGSWRTIAAETCTVDGMRTRSCSLCGHTENDTIKASGHNEVIDAAKAATCKNEGKTAGSHCGTCGVVIVAQQTIAKKAHTEGSDGICTACGTDVLMENLKAGLNIKLIVPSVGSAKNYYCQVKYTNNTEYTIASAMTYASINGELLCGFDAANFVLNPNQYVFKSYYTSFIEREIYDEKNKNLYLDKESEGYVVINVKGKNVFVWIGTSGPITFGYSLADIGIA